MNNQTYNGYPNRVTWTVALWIDNDEGMLETVLDTAEQYDNGYELGEWLKEWLETDAANPLGDQANMYSDLLTYALACVDWHYLGISYKQEQVANEWTFFNYDGLLDHSEGNCCVCSHADGTDETGEDYMSVGYADSDGMSFYCPACFEKMYQAIGTNH